MYFDHIHFKLSLEENLKIIGSIVKEINIKTRQLTSSSTNVWHFYTTLFNAQPFLKTATRTHHMISACHVIHVLHIHAHSYTCRLVQQKQSDLHIHRWMCNRSLNFNQAYLHTSTTFLHMNMSSDTQRNRTNSRNLY